MSLGVVTKNIQNYLNRLLKYFFQPFICMKLDFLNALQQNNRMKAEADMRMYFSYKPDFSIFYLEKIYFPQNISYINI